MESTALRSPARPRLARRGAAVAAALALALGAAACTGDEEQPAPTPSSEAAPSDGVPGTGASDDGGQEVTEADLDAASERFLGFLQVVDDQDWEGACGLVLDPDTDTAPEGERLQACADGAQEAMEEYEQLLEPGAFDALDPSMVRAEPAEDGTISLSVLEQDIDVPMIRGEDGDWYLSIPF